MIEHIQWLEHGSFLIQTTPIIYINPWRVRRAAFHADVILISHEHYDHFSLADIQKLTGATTRIIGPSSVAKVLPQTEIIRPWQSITIDRCRITARPAYSPQSLRHPQDDDHLGFVISLNYFDIYYAGDTQLIPEMRGLQPDIAILPIDGDGTMTVEEAVQAVDILKPRWAYPANWGDTDEGADPADALRFQRLVGDKAQVILPNDLSAK